MSILTREEMIQAGAPRKSESVHIPEWGGDVFVREITAGEYDVIQLAIYDAGKRGSNREFRARWVSAFLCDESGARLFSDGEIATIANMGAKAIDRIYEAGQKFNKLDEADELEKNAEAVQ